MTGPRRPRRPWLGVAVAALACEPTWAGFGAHACAAVEGGAVLCWGSNAHGQLGDGSWYDRPAAAAVVGLPAARSVAAGNGFTCAATAAGEAWCWGRNDRGQLGAGPGGDRAVPGRIAALDGVAALAAGEDAACAVRAAGEVLCWGRLGATRRDAPTAVTGLPAPAVEVALGQGIACARLDDGRILCAGEDLAAQDTGRAGASAVAVFAGAPCAIFAGGTVACAAPTGATGTLPLPATALAAGPTQACAVLEGGEVWCWGTWAFGPPKRFSSGTPFGPSPFASGAAAVAVGEGFACARLGSGGVACWGDGWSGQLGDGANRQRAAPVPVGGLPAAAVAVAASRGRLVWDYGCGTVARPEEDD